MRRPPIRISAYLALATAALAACAASLPMERRDYILSRPHGWVELTVADLSVPRVPESQEAGAELVRPAYCAVEIGLDREPIVSGAVYPSGDQPPFVVSSGFRFPAPAGDVHLRLVYRNCDVAEGQASDTTAEVDLQVSESLVTEVVFDGERLVASAPRADTAVTLEHIYQAITGRRRPTP